MRGLGGHREEPVAGQGQGLDRPRPHRTSLPAPGERANREALPWTADSPQPGSAVPPMAGCPGRPSVVRESSTWEATMPVGEIFLYLMWALIAIGALVASALMFRAGR
jgi:hypothetical protein